MQKVFCDRCKQPLEGRNVGRVGLIIPRDETSKGFSVEITVSYADARNNGDLCQPCVLELINQKPKRKYERKQKGIQKGEIAGVPVFVTEEIESTPDGFKKVKPVANEELIIQAPTRECQNYGVNILGRLGVASTLKEAVNDAIAHEPAWEGKIPESLSKKNRELLEDILS